MDDKLIGTQINRYKLLECLNTTELISYFRAYDTKLERNVIMKLVLHSIDYSEDAVEYFLNESKALAKLVHPNIAKVLDFGFENRNLYLISEDISGESLSTLMNGPMDWQQAVDILLPLTDALNYAHSRNVIHRDLKPENIILSEDGRLVLNDFSLVKIIEDEETRDMTGTKVGLGSPAYISPEQGKGLPADFRSDIYSLGVIFYEMITGQKPFSHGSSMEIVIQHVTSEPPRPKSIIPSLPVSIEKIILTALSKDIGKRYQSMDEFSDALKATLPDVQNEKEKKNVRIPFSRNRIILLASVLVLFVAGAVFLAWQFRQTPASTQPDPTNGIDPTRSALTPIKIETIPPPGPTIQSSSVSTAEGTSQEQPEFSPGIAIGENTSAARHENTSINTVSFIDHARMVIAGTGAGLYFYNSADLALRYFINTKGPVSAVALSNDGTLVATGDQNGNVAIWDMHNGKELARFEGHSGALASLDISPDKTRLVSASGNTVYLWDINKKVLLFTFQKHAFNVNKVLFSSDGQYFISGGDDFQVMFSSVLSGELVKKYSCTQKINDISISPDGATMVLALNNATIEIRNYDDGQIEKTFQDQKIIDPYKFSKFLPNNSLFASGSEKGAVRIWNISGNLIWETPQKDQKINALKAFSVSEDGVKIVTVSDENLVTVWDLPQQSLQVSKNLADVPIPDTTVATSAGLTYSLPLVPVIEGVEIPKTSANLDKSNLKDISELARWGNPKINAVSFIDNAHMILAATSAGVYFYDSTDLSLKYFFDAKGWLSTFCVSQDGTLVATGDQDGNIAVWNIVDGKEIARFKGQPEEIISLAISSDKTLIASVDNTKIISLWDLKQNQLKYSFKKHALRVNKILFSPDSQYVISGGDDFKIMFWDVDSGAFVKEYSSNQKIDDMTISPDGTTIALALNDATIEVRSYKDGQIKKDFKDQKIVDAYKLIKFLPNNSLLLSGSENGVARVWNINGSMIWETPKEDKDGKTIGANSLKSFSISDDGVKVVTLSDDNLINVWDINLKSLLASRKLNYGSVDRMSISSGNKMLAYQAGAHVDVWSIENHKHIGQLDGYLPRGYPFSANNDFLVTQVNDTLSLYSLKAMPPAFMYTLNVFPFRGTVNYLLDDKIVAAATTGILKYWSLSSGRELSTSAPTKTNGNCRLFYRDDGQFLAAASINGILNIESNVKYFCHVSRGPRTISEDFLSDGSIIALSLENQALEIWDIRAGEQKISIKSKAQGNMLDVAISDDGKLLAATSTSGIVEIYDLNTGELIQSFEAHNAAVTQIAFTSDLKYIISASTDGTVRFWGITVQ